jgi:hypothetical protein
MTTTYNFTMRICSLLNAFKTTRDHHQDKALKPVAQRVLPSDNQQASAMLNAAHRLKLVMLFCMMGTAIDSSVAEPAEAVTRFSFSTQTRQRMAELPDKYQNFLLSDRILFSSLPRAELIELLEGKSAQQLEEIIQELIWLDSKLSIRTTPDSGRAPADSNQVDQQNLDQINDLLDSFITD